MDERETPHERMVRVAGELLYAEGITATGVDRVAEVVGVSKRTLYKHFGSKDRLVADWLAALDGRVRALLTTHDAALPPSARLLAVFDAAEEMLRSPQFRGCPYVNAVGELADGDHPARAVAAAHKQALLDWLTATATAAGAGEPAALAQQLMVLLDGAMAQRAVLGDRFAFRPVAAAARLLVAAATPGSDRAAASASRSGGG